MNALGLSQPLLIVLIELALLYALIQLDVIGFPQNGEHLVVYLPHSLIGVFNELEDAHEDFAFVEDAFESDCVKNVAVDAMQHLADELGVVLLAQEEGQHRLEKF